MGVRVFRRIEAVGIGVRVGGRIRGLVAAAGILLVGVLVVIVLVLVGIVVVFAAGHGKFGGRLTLRCPRRQIRVGLTAARMVVDQPDDADQGESHPDEDRCRDAAELPIPVRPKRLEPGTCQAVPDAPDRGQVARLKPAQEAAREVEHEQAAQDVERRLVEEQRLEARAEIERALWRAEPGRDAMSAVDGDAPRQVRRRPVQLLVEEVAPARNALGKERPGDDRVER